MALTITKLDKNVNGAVEEVVADVTFDNSYPTGGESLTAANLGLKDIQVLDAKQKGVANRVAEYDYGNAKLMLFTALGTQATNASDQSAIVVRVFARSSAVAI